MVDQGEFLLQSDNEDLVEFMVEAIETSPYFVNENGAFQTVEEPFSEAKTEREVYYAKRNLPVWRYRYRCQKTNGTAHELSRGGVDRIRTGESRFCKPLP